MDLIDWQKANSVVDGYRVNITGSGAHLVNRIKILFYAPEEENFTEFALWKYNMYTLNNYRIKSSSWPCFNKYQV